MYSTTLLVFLTLIGSGLCWLPVLIEPGLDFSLFFPLACVALCTSLSTVINRRWWLLFVFAAAAGTFAGSCLGSAIWWPSDPIAGPLVPVLTAVTTVLAIVVSVVAGFASRKVVTLQKINRRGLWVALIGCLTLGPIALALTPPLVAYRIARNDRVAAVRFTSLKNAVEGTRAEAGDRRRICDGSTLKRHYSGPSFSNEDWRRITGNYVEQDSYFFMVHCNEKNGYTIDASPARLRGGTRGTRRFCTDESGQLSCAMEWNRSRYACLPCNE
jgi:hypothetical protein